MKAKLYDLMNWAQIEGIVYSEEDKPAAILGARQVGNAALVQAFFPDAKKVTLVWKEKQKRVVMDMADEEGFFAALVPGMKTEGYVYEVLTKDGKKEVREDPYAYEVSIAAEELERFNAGINYHIYKILGSHEVRIKQCRGLQFAVWVPGAVRVSVIGEFNDWDGRRMPMNRVGNSSIFTLFVPDLEEDAKYLYEVKVKNGSVYKMTDPYAINIAEKEGCVSKPHKEENFSWEDKQWRKARKEKEVRAFSWDGKEEKEISELITQIKQQGFQYVLLPRFYPENSFYKVVECFREETQAKSFVNEMHKAGIGVLCNWDVSGCQELYKKQMSNFYIANVLYQMEEFHMDGLVFSGMEKLLYLDYGKEEGQWSANAYGGNENLEGVEFIKHTNSILTKKEDSLILMADMDAIWPKVTKDLNSDGLGFKYRFDNAFAKNFIEYLTKKAEERVHIHEKIISRMEYAYEEKFVMAFMAEDVENLWKLLPGKENEKFSTMKAAFSYISFLPGKTVSGFKVPEKKQKEYAALVKRCFDLNEEFEALEKEDANEANFRWLNCNQRKECTVSFWRNHEKEENSLLVVANFGAEERKEFKIGVPKEGKYELIFDSEETTYGGIRENLHEYIYSQDDGWDGYAQEIKVNMLPFSVSVYRYVPFTEEEIYALAEKRAEELREKIMEEARRKVEQLKKIKGNK